jgi:hypothetical protein
MDGITSMSTSALFALRHRLQQEQRSIYQRWRAARGDGEIVMQLLRLWGQEQQVAHEMRRRQSTAAFGEVE